MSSDRKVVLIIRKSRYEELIEQYNTESQAAFVIESRGDSFDDYRNEHMCYHTAISNVSKVLRTRCRLQTIDRLFLPNFIFGRDDVVVVIGQDGLVANTLKYLQGQSVIAINPEPDRYDGMLLPFTVEDTKAVLTDVLSDRCDNKVITMAEANLNDGQRLLAVNDLFVGPKFQTSARYELSFEGKAEMQSSSGVIISTGLGSTGWLKSIFTGAQSMLQTSDNTSIAFDWEANFLRYVVREPFPSKVTGTSLTYGDISDKKRLVLSSKMGEGGIIFSDGMLDDYLDFNSGTIATIKTAKEQGNLVC